MTQRGLSITELMIGLAVGAVILVIAATQMQSLGSLFMGIRAESTVKQDLVLAGEAVKVYFQTKRTGGVFECASEPVFGTDSYCYLADSCTETTANSYADCRMISILRGDPLDVQTNPDRIQLVTSCAPSTSHTHLVFPSNCGHECPVGQYPVFAMTRTNAAGVSRVSSYPGGVIQHPGRQISGDETRAMEFCISKSDLGGKSIVNFSLTGYYLSQGKVKSIKRDFSLSESTTANEQLEFLP